LLPFSRAIFALQKWIKAEVVVSEFNFSIIAIALSNTSVDSSYFCCSLKDSAKK